MRQEKTLKIVGNHFVVDFAPYCDLRPNSGSDKCWVWTALDCADEEPAAEQFALKFGSPELAAKFKEAFGPGPCWAHCRGFICWALFGPGPLGPFICWALLGPFIWALLGPFV